MRTRGGSSRPSSRGWWVVLLVGLVAVAGALPEAGGSAGPGSVTVLGSSALASGALSAAAVRAMSAAESSLTAGTGPVGGTGISCSGSVALAEVDCAGSVAAATAASGSLPSPTHRWGAEITYDAADGYPLLFGGQSDTWAFENGTWVDLHPKVIPPIVSFACLTYDWKDGYVLLYGGGRGGIGTPDINRNQTWSFRAGVWTNRTDPADTPPGLQYPSCTYDAAPGDGYVVLFGGADAEGPTYTGGSYLTIHSSDQTWKYSGGRWTNLTDLAAPHPSARFGASMVYDSTDGYVLLYGGAVNGTSTANGSCTPAECPHLDDTWTYHGGTWTNITATASVHGTPPGRWEAGIANDSAAGYIVIFGGQANGYKSYNATANFTWVFSGGVWRNLSASLPVSPQPRFGEAMGYDPASKSILMFSGLNSTREAILWENTWAFYAGGWHDLTFFLNFTEQGLPAGQSWSVTVTPAAGPALTLANTTDRLSFGWATGNDSYAVKAVSGYHITLGSSTGIATVSDPSIVVGWSPVKFTVKFSENGLKAAWHAPWSVTLDGKEKSSTVGSISFAGLSPGSYPFTIAAVTNYSLNRSYTGTAVVASTGESEVAETIELRWTLITYHVTFEETGLPAHTSWSVTLNGVTKTSNTSKVTFSISNGSYAFSASVPGYTAAPASGEVLVAGQATTQPVSFAPTASPLLLAGNDRRS